MKEWTIYKIENPLKQIYIGCTSNFEVRMKSYRMNSSSIKKQRLLHKSLTDFALNNHKVDILDTFQGTDNEAYSKEMFWIRTMMSNSCKWPEIKGLNLSDGGPGIRGNKKSSEARERQSRLMIGKKLSDKHKEACLQARANSTKVGKRIYQYDLYGNLINTYSKVKIAANAVGVKSNTISMHLKGHKKTCAGFIFKYDLQ